MNILYATYLFASAIILLVLAVIGWKHRYVVAGREFALFSASVGFMLAAYALELTQENLDGLKQSERLLWFFGSYTTTFWLLFSLVWSGYGHVANRFLRAALLAFSTLTMLLAQTNDYHGLIYTRMWMDSSGPFPILQGQEGLWYRVYWAYVNGCNVIINIMFIRQFRNVRPLHRRQALIMVLASFIPWLMDIGYELGIGDGLFLTAFGLSITALLCAWGIFRRQLLDMTPVARHGLVEMMCDPVLVFDDSGCLLDHNLAACRFLCDDGNHGAEITRADISRRIPELVEALERAEQGEIDTFRYNDQIFSLSLTALNPTADNTLTLCLLHDITGQYRAEESLRLLNANLEERITQEVALNRVKDQALARQARIAAMGEMVGAIAHQWRQPLAILSMIVQDLHAAAHQGETPSLVEWDQFRSDAMEQILHMSQTIEEFRNFQRPDQKREQFPAVRCLEESVRLSGAQFKEHHIIQELRIPAGEIPCCCGIPSQLTQVLLTLLANAREAIMDSRVRNGGQPEQGEVVLALAVTGEYLRITVSDNGCGVPEEQRDRIFEPYITTKEEQGGSGFGLYLARMLLESGFGGELGYAALPEGASFIIELPANREEPA